MTVIVRPIFVKRHETVKIIEGRLVVPMLDLVMNTSDGGVNDTLSMIAIVEADSLSYPLRLSKPILQAAIDSSENFSGNVPARIKLKIRYGGSENWPIEILKIQYGSISRPK